jgi:alanine racemase
MTEPRAGAVLEVDLGAIVANWQLLCRKHRSGLVAAVVKADGYGLGARPIAMALAGAGCKHFFVALPEEAFALRGHVPGAMLSVLNGLLPGMAPEYVAHNIVPVLGSLAEIDEWTALARQSGRALPAIVHVDTGMSRLGLSREEVAVLAAEPDRLAGLDMRYIMTHLVSSEVPGDQMNPEQIRRFAGACAILPKAPRSVANSSGIFLGEAYGSDLARPGAALYGINPVPERHNPMRQVVRLRARVLAVRQIGAVEPVGYNATWRAGRSSRIATVAIGYADGWHRSLSNRGHAVFDGQRVPLVGRVSMDLATFDVTEHPGVRPGEWLELLGSQQTPDDVARDAGTNGYEVLTSLGRRFQRDYRGA